MDEKVESVKIVTEKPMLNGSLTLFLECCSDDKKYWKSPLLFLHANEEDTFRYRYVVKYKEGFGMWLLKTVTRSKDETTVKETKTRKLNRGINQYDIFHHPKDPNWRKNIFSGQFFYVKLLCRALGRGCDLRELLIECEHVGFGHPSYVDEDVKLFLKWVEDLVNNRSYPYQGVYVCSLLGQFIHHVQTWPVNYTCQSLGEKTTDLILTSFGCCPYVALPQTSVKFIKIVAEDLFKAGSSTGSLLFIKYFCSLLDVNYVLQVADKLSSRPYTEQQFDQHVPNLLNTLKSLKDQATCVRYLSYVINRSPSVHCLWNVHPAISCHLPDLKVSLVEEFSDAYCRLISRRRGRKPDLLQPLFWCQVPEKLKEKIANPFCKTLTEQIASETTCSKKDVDSLITIALDESLYSSEHFHDFILCVATHKTKEIVSILPVLLESKVFCFYWKSNISHEEKEKVCQHWLRNGVFEAGMKPKDKVLAAVEACDALCTTEAVKSDKALYQAVEKEVERLVFKSSLDSIMSAFEDAERFTPAVHERLTLLLRSAIKQHSGTGDRRSRYRKMIRMLGYDDVSKVRKKDLQKDKLDR